MKEQQIDKQAVEEIAKMIDNACDVIPLGECYDVDCSLCQATHLYNAGYRKQSEGEWVVAKTERAWNDAEYPYTHRCSVCGNEEPSQSLTPYCPNCGAKMKGGAE